MVGLFGMGKELYSFGTLPNEMAGSSIGALLRDGQVREEANSILAEARQEIEDLLREKSAMVEGVRDVLLEREEIVGDDIDRLFAELESPNGHRPAQAAPCGVSSPQNGTRKLGSALASARRVFGRR
jgi:hypothetical protein